MKNIYLLVLIAFSMPTFSQSHFNFIIKNDNPEIKGDTTNLILPVSILFKENDFTEKEILFRNPVTKTKISGKEKKFGRDVKIGPQDNGYYKIDLVINEGKVQVSGFTGFDEYNCPDNSVILELLGKQFLIRYKDTVTMGDDLKKGQNYNAGYIYYDAMALISDTILPLTKLKILKSYGYEGSMDNPYLIKHYDDENSKAIKNAEEKVSLTGSPFLTNLGNTDVTNFAAGLAGFLAVRAKEELNEAFFNRMKEKLNAYPELKTVFPKTTSFLDKIVTYSYTSVIQVLKEAFEADIQNIPENLYQLKDLSSTSCDASILKGNKLKNCQDRMDWLSSYFNSSEGRWIGLGMFTVKEAVQASNPANLLKSIAGSDELQGIKKFSENSLYADYNIASSIELSNFISQSLISKDDNQVWITSKELNALNTNEDAFKIYLGLLLSFEQRKDKDKQIFKFYKNDNIIDTTTFGKILLQVHDSIDTYLAQVKSLIKNTYTAYNSANNAVKKILAASDKSIETDPQALYDYYRTFTASLKPIATSPFLKHIIRKDFGIGYAKVEQIVNPAVDIAYHISIKKYSATIYDASILLSGLDTYKISVDKKFLGMKVGTKNEMIFKPFTKSFVKYGTLISTVANAQSSDEVKQAMESSVLPAGSYSIKRKTKWSTSINGYVGTYWSYAKNKDITYPAWGLSAPIGFNISRGFSDTGNCGGMSLNVQILDLGALVNYYLIKGDTASIPNNFSVKLSNIFAPGFNLCYNIPKTPLSIAWGGQYIPTLYKYEQINGKNELTPTNAWRWQLSLLIDIPLFNLKVWDFK